MLEEGKIEVNHNYLHIGDIFNDKKIRSAVEGGYGFSGLNNGTYRIIPEYKDNLLVRIVIEGDFMPKRTV